MFSEAKLTLVYHRKVTGDSQGSVCYPIDDGQVTLIGVVLTESGVD